MPSATKPVVRFAPSPTGRLHIGNIRTAVLNWLFARKGAGTFMLRIDDTDIERSREEFAEGIREDLRWLGLTWDREMRQSDRFARYAAQVEHLKASGRLYACYETAAELDRRRKLQLARGAPPVYDRAALRLTAAERAAHEAAGRRPHWRFLLENYEGSPSRPVHRSVTWDDLIRGPQSIDIGSLSDPVLVREDGAYLYTLASVIDDIDLGITHVIRGEDHVTNTAVQIQIFEALGAVPCAFAHHSLLIGPDGEGLSKRLGALSIRSFREEGLEPVAVTSVAATIGTSDPVAPHETLGELTAQFELAKISRSPARFDTAELHAINAKLLHLLAYESVRQRLAEEGIGGGEAFWIAIRGNLAAFADAKAWWGIVSGPIAPRIEDAAFCKEAARLLPEGEWSEATWGEWTGTIKTKTGRKGRELFHPLRLALTGREAGPEMKLLLPMIGRKRAVERLAGMG